jgi:hypothetical protein
MPPLSLRISTLYRITKAWASEKHYLTLKLFCVEDVGRYIFELKTGYLPEDILELKDEERICWNKREYDEKEVMGRLFLDELSENSTRLSYASDRLGGNVAASRDQARKELFDFWLQSYFTYLLLSKEEWTANAAEPPQWLLEAAGYPGGAPVKHNGSIIQTTKQNKRGPGRPHYEEDVWAHNQVFLCGQPMENIKSLWLSKVEENPKRSDIYIEELNRQFRKIMEGNWGNKAG